MDNLTFLERPKLSDEVVVLGVPLDLGKVNEGTEGGPKAIREAGLVPVLMELGCRVKDAGDVSCPDRGSVTVGDPKMKYLEPITDIAEKTSTLVEKHVAAGNKVVVLGGDNTISIGSISGASAALKGDIGIIWIDAHGDINTDETTISGNIHGMPIAAVLGLGHSSLVNVNHPGKKVDPQNVVFVGLKDLDQAEIDIIRSNKIPTETMLDIAGNGLRGAFEKISALQSRVSAVWVCLDIDSIDKEYAPATLMATSGGLTYREVTNLAKYIGKTCRVAGIDVSELAPHLDKEHLTAELVVELIAGLLGSESNWYTRYMQNEAA